MWAIKVLFILSVPPLPIQTWIAGICLQVKQQKFADLLFRVGDEPENFYHQLIHSSAFNSLRSHRGHTSSDATTRKEVISHLSIRMSCTCLHSRIFSSDYLAMIQTSGKCSQRCVYRRVFACGGCYDMQVRSRWVWCQHGSSPSYRKCQASSLYRQHVTGMYLTVCGCVCHQNPGGALSVWVTRR